MEDLAINFKLYKINWYYEYKFHAWCENANQTFCLNDFP